MAKPSVDLESVNALRHRGYITLGDYVRINLEAIALFGGHLKDRHWKAIWPVNQGERGLLPHGKELWFVDLDNPEKENNLIGGGRIFCTKDWETVKGRDNSRVRIIFKHAIRESAKVREYLGEFKLMGHDGSDQRREIWLRVAKKTDLPPPEATT